MGKTVVQQQSEGELRSMYAADIREAMCRQPHVIPTKHLYDDIGVRLFAAFCDSAPDHYEARQAALLDVAVHESLGCESRAWVEFGAGSCRSVRRMLETLNPRLPLSYRPIDISPVLLMQALMSLEKDFPTLALMPAICDFETWPADRYVQAGVPTDFLFLGNSFCNMDGIPPHLFLARLREVCHPESRLILGMALGFDQKQFKASYHDTGGHFDRFRWNALTRLQTELGANIRQQDFHLRSEYNAQLCRGESFFEAMTSTHIEIPSLEISVQWPVGERMVIGSTQRYDKQSLDDTMRHGGWAPTSCVDAGDDEFMLLVYRPIASSVRKAQP